jgi:uncharacterized protein YjbK
MLNGKVITDFTVEEQFAQMKFLYLEKKEHKLKLLQTKLRIKAAADASAAAMKGKVPLEKCLTKHNQDL